MRAHIAAVSGNCLVLADGRGGAFGRPQRADERIFREALRESEAIEQRKAEGAMATFDTMRPIAKEARPYLLGDVLDRAIQANGKYIGILP